MKNKHYIFEDLFNVRDLGGYDTEDGYRTKQKRFIRGTAKGTLTTNEKEELYDIGVRVIVDLRNSHEIMKEPHPLREHRDIVYYSIDMIGSFDNMYARGYSDISGLYFDLLDHSQDKIRDVFRVFAKYPHDTIYINCTAGKDRTGVISMLLLKLVSVSDEDIIENYVESYENLKVRYQNETPAPEMLLYTLAKGEYMTKTLNYLMWKHHSAHEYLLKIGVSEEEIDLIINSFRYKK